MNRIDGKRLFTVLTAFALSFSLIGAVSAPGSADAPRTLLNEQWQSGAVTGSRGGAYAYFAIQYPGDQSVVTIELRHWPADSVTQSAVGFNVYAPNGFWIGQGLRLDNLGGDGVLQLQYADDNQATWLVQVYNYLPGYGISYGIVATGLPPVPVQPVTPPQPWGSQLLGVGYLTGRNGGVCQYFGVTVVAGAPDVQLKMNSSPDDPLIAPGVGFVVYDPSGQVKSGQITSTAGERKLTLAANAPGVYRVQVCNYIEGLTIRYMLTSAPVGG